MYFSSVYYNCSLTLCTCQASNEFLRYNKRESHDGRHIMQRIMTKFHQARKEERNTTYIATSLVPSPLSLSQEDLYLRAQPPGSNVLIGTYLYLSCRCPDGDKTQIIKLCVLPEGGGGGGVGFVVFMSDCYYF